MYLAGLGKLTQDLTSEGHPAWSPDGTRIAYVSSRTGEGDIYLLNLVHGESRVPRRLTFTEREAELFPVWNSAGDELCFVRHTATGDQLVIMDGLEALHPREKMLTEWPSTQTKPSWSPGGGQIAFYSNHRDSKQLDVWICDTKSGTNPVKPPRLLVEGVRPAARHGPAWTPDGRFVLTVADDSAKFDPILLVFVKTGQVLKLDTSSVNNRDPVFGVRAGGLRLFFSAQGLSRNQKDRMWYRIYEAKLDLEAVSNGKK
jgi:Tol biopolymer transport system component